MNEEIKKNYLNLVSRLKYQFNSKQIYFDGMPKFVLVKLLELAIDKIDNLENCYEFDERDFKDTICDKFLIVDDLFTKLNDYNLSDIFFVGLNNHEK